MVTGTSMAHKHGCHLLSISAHFECHENFCESVRFSIPPETHSKDSSSQLLQLVIKFNMLVPRSHANFHSIRSELKSSDSIKTSVSISISSHRYWGLILAMSSQAQLSPNILREVNQAVIRQCWGTKKKGAQQRPGKVRKSQRLPYWRITYIYNANLINASAQVAARKGGLLIK